MDLRLPLLLGLAACHAVAPAHAPTPAEHPSLAPRQVPGEHLASRQPLVLRAGHVLSPEGTLTGPMTIVLDGPRIAALGADLAAPPGAQILELPDATILPGLIDTHTHVMASGADDYLGELVRKSLPFRALEASAHVRVALAHGFTSLRDVESEGAMYADVDLREAVNRGLVPGPRLFVSTRGLSTVGRYLPLDGAWDVELPTGAQLVVGEVEARRAVREQIGHGADWIKVYVDFIPFHLDADGALHGPLNFTDAELGAIVSEAHKLGHRVAAHATTQDGIAQALSAGVDSLEHAWGLDEALAKRALAQHVFVCPTTLAEAQLLEHAPPDMRAVLEQAWKNLARAHRLGVKLAFATDAGSFPWEGPNQASGLSLYVEKLGMTPREALASATRVAAELLGQSDQLGVIRPGALADLIAVRGDPLADVKVVEHPVLVVIDGQVFHAEAASR
jgi:imidazolonepropionase-like amidohydrolase